MYRETEREIGRNARFLGVPVEAVKAALEEAEALFAEEAAHYGRFGEAETESHLHTGRGAGEAYGGAVLYIDLRRTLKSAGTQHALDGTYRFGVKAAKGELFLFENGKQSPYGKQQDG